MYPARWFFHTHQRRADDGGRDPPVVRRRLYVVMPEFDLAKQAAHLEITVTPLINWVWLGFGMIALGTLIALLPETAFAFASAACRRTRPGRRGHG